MLFICSIICGFLQNGIMLFVSPAFQGIGSVIGVPGVVVNIHSLPKTRGYIRHQ